MRKCRISASSDGVDSDTNVRTYSSLWRSPPDGREHVTPVEDSVVLMAGTMCNYVYVHRFGKVFVVLIVELYVYMA